MIIFSDKIYLIVRALERALTFCLPILCNYTLSALKSLKIDFMFFFLNY